MTTFANQRGRSTSLEPEWVTFGFKPRQLAQSELVQRCLREANKTLQVKCDGITSAAVPSGQHPWPLDWPLKCSLEPLDAPWQASRREDPSSVAPQRALKRELALTATAHSSPVWDLSGYQSSYVFYTWFLADQTETIQWLTDPAFYDMEAYEHQFHVRTQNECDSQSVCLPDALKESPSSKLELSLSSYTDQSSQVAKGFELSFEAGVGFSLTWKAMAENDEDAGSYYIVHIVMEKVNGSVLGAQSIPIVIRSPCNDADLIATVLSVPQKYPFSLIGDTFTDTNVLKIFTYRFRQLDGKDVFDQTKINVFDSDNQRCIVRIETVQQKFNYDVWKWDSCIDPPLVISETGAGGSILARSGQDCLVNGEKPTDTIGELVHVLRLKVKYTYFNMNGIDSIMSRTKSSFMMLGDCKILQEQPSLTIIPSDSQIIVYTDAKNSDMQEWIDFVLPDDLLHIDGNTDIYCGGQLDTDISIESLQGIDVTVEGNTVRFPTGNSLDGQVTVTVTTRISMMVDDGDDPQEVTDELTISFDFYLRALQVSDQLVLKDNTGSGSNEGRTLTVPMAQHSEKSYKKVDFSAFDLSVALADGMVNRFPFSQEPYTLQEGLVDGNVINEDYPFEYIANDDLIQIQRLMLLGDNDNMINFVDDSYILECDEWSSDKVSQTITVTETFSWETPTQVQGTIDLSFFCQYEECSNHEAQKQGLVASPGSRITRLDMVEYLVHTGPLEIQLPELETYCPQAPAPEVSITSSSLILADGSIKPNERGVTIRSQGQSQTLVIEADDSALYGAQLELELIQFLPDDSSWAQSTRLKIVYSEPPCQITQADIDEAVAGQTMQITLEAMAGQKTDEFSFAEYTALANQAMRTSERTFCGPMSQSFVFEEMFSADTRDTSFYIFNSDSETVGVAPQLIHQPGQYQGVYLRYQFRDYPDLQVNVQIFATILPCETTSAQFSKSEFTTTYIIGDPSQTLSLKPLKLEPDCGVQATLSDLSLTPIEVPEGHDLSSLVSTGADGLTVKVFQSEDYALLNQQVKFTLEGRIEAIDLSTTVSVTFESDGPRFKTTSYQMPDLEVEGSQKQAAKEGDPVYEFILPPVLSEEELNVGIELLNDTPESQLFAYDQETRVVRLKPEVEQLFKKGEATIKPGAYQLTFELKSDLLGTSQAVFFFTVPEQEVQEQESASTFVFDFDQYFDYDKALAQASGGELTIPTIEIASVDKLGRLVIVFSDDFIVPEDPMARLTAKEFTLKGVPQSNLELLVAPEEGQTAEAVAFKWTVKSFSTQQLILQLDFDQPYEISQGFYKNTIMLNVWQPAVFLREADRRSITSGTKLSVKLPEMVEQGSLELALQVASLVSSVGKSTIVFFVIVAFLGTYGLSQVLGEVANLSIITHLMMVQVQVPDTSRSFFSGVFGIVSFDLIPTDWLYGWVFSFEDVPYSDEADAIGYVSRFVISNLGSLSLVIFSLPLLLLLYYALSKCLSKDRKLQRFAQGKLDSFFVSGLIEFYDEVYLCMCFACGINLTSLEFDQPSVSVNNSFAIVVGVALTIGPIVIVQRVRKAWKALDKWQKRMDAIKAGDDAVADLQGPSGLDIKEGGEAEDIITPIKKKPTYGKKKGIKTGRRAKKGKCTITRAVQNDDNVNSTADMNINILAVEHKDQAQAIEEEEQPPQKPEVRSYGSLVDTLPGPKHTSRARASLYILARFYEKYLLAVLILSFYTNQSIQVISCLLVKFGYLAFIAGSPVHENPQEHRKVVQGESFIVLTIYFLMCFTNQYVAQGSTRNNLGFCLIGLIVINFSLSLFPLLTPVKRWIKKRYLFCKAKEQREKAEFIKQYPNDPNLRSKDCLLQRARQMIAQAAQQDKTEEEKAMERLAQEPNASQDSESESEYDSEEDGSGSEELQISEESDQKMQGQASRAPNTPIEAERERLESDFAINGRNQLPGSLAPNRFAEKRLEDHQKTISQLLRPAPDAGADGNRLPRLQSNMANNWRRPSQKQTDPPKQKREYPLQDLELSSRGHKPVDETLKKSPPPHSQELSAKEIDQQINKYVAKMKTKLQIMVQLREAEFSKIQTKRDNSALFPYDPAYGGEYASADEYRMALDNQLKQARHNQAVAHQNLAELEQIEFYEPYRAKPSSFVGRDYMLRNLMNRVGLPLHEHLKHLAPSPYYDRNQRVKR